MSEKPESEPESMGPIVLITDFGNSDPYVGQMKGVIASIAPEVKVIDLCHHVPPMNVIVAGMFLKGSYKYFPHGSIFVVVVDPGVGTERDAIILHANNRYAIGPSNGCLWPVTVEGVEWEGVRIENPDYMLPDVSPTFHGRDIFAPVAAYLSTGIPLAGFGPKIETLVELPKPKAQVDGNVITGRVIHIDHFGNAWTNIPKRLLRKLGWLEDMDKIVTEVAACTLSGLKKTYIAETPNKPIALINSFDLIEIAWPGGSARKRMVLEEGIWVKMILNR